MLFRSVPGILLIMVFTGLFGLVDVNTGVFMVLFVIVFILLDALAAVSEETGKPMVTVLIQYDITAGKNYLKDTDFMTLP